MLYAIGSESGSVKIGITENFGSRFNAIQTGNPEKLSVLKTWELPSREHDKFAETMLHWQLARYRQNGEWFYLSKQGIDWLLRRIPSDFTDPVEEDIVQLEFEDAPLDVKTARQFRLSPQFIKWLDDMKSYYNTTRTSVLERLSALPYEEREIIRDMLHGAFRLPEEPHTWPELLEFDKGLAEMLSAYPELSGRVQRLLLLEQQYIVSGELQWWAKESEFSSFREDDFLPTDEVIEREPYYD